MTEPIMNTGSNEMILLPEKKTQPLAYLQDTQLGLPDPVRLVPEDPTGAIVDKVDHSIF